MLKRKTPLKRGGRLHPYSKKRKALNDTYLELRKDYLLEHPYCMHFMQENGIDEDVAVKNMGIVLVKRKDGQSDGDWDWGHCPKATQIHHRKGRVGNLLIDMRWWMAVSEEGHRKIHNDPKTSYEKGYMVPR